MGKQRGCLLLWGKKSPLSVQHSIPLPLAATDSSLSHGTFHNILGKQMDSRVVKTGAKLKSWSVNWAKVMVIRASWPSGLSKSGIKDWLTNRALGKAEPSTDLRGSYTPEIIKHQWLRSLLCYCVKRKKRIRFDVLLWARDGTSRWVAVGYTSKAALTTGGNWKLHWLIFDQCYVILRGVVHSRICTDFKSSKKSLGIFQHWNRGVFHSQTRCTDFKSSKNPWVYWIFFGFFRFFRIF